MWRKKQLSFRKNAQQEEVQASSDHSISEEEGEGLESEWTVNTISLGEGVSDNKGGMQVLSQLDLLRDSYDLHSTERKSHEINAGFCVDDEVENPHFSDEDVITCNQRYASATHERIICLPTVASIAHSDGENISDDEKVSASVKIAGDNEGSRWSQANREVRALVSLNENCGFSSSHNVFLNENRQSKGGGRTKPKPKFLFRSYSHKKEPSMVVSGGNGRTSSNNIPSPDEIDAAYHGDMDTFMADSQLIVHDNESEKPENHIGLAHKHEPKKQSMAEFLDCFQERSGMLKGRPELEIEKRGKRAQMGSKRSTSTLGDRNLDDNDLSDDVDSEPLVPSDNEENPHSLMVVPRRTMADHFHEAFGTVSVMDERPELALPRPLCNGIYGKLQRVLQNEKERDMDYLKNLSAETNVKDENLSISVRILSRSLEAKLIVCSCISVGDGKNTYWGNNLQMDMNDAARNLTIIFNPRICSEAELEVGNLIRIHQPWKEVPVKGKDEVVYLCSYFSQVQS